jgi:hypothetical protein
VCRPKHVEQIKNIGIINSTTRLHLFGSFYEFFYPYLYYGSYGNMWNFSRIDWLIFLFDRQSIFLWATTEFLSIFKINFAVRKVKTTWHTIDILEAVILVNHAAYECPSNTRRSEADISTQIFWINTCRVTGFRSVRSNGEFDVWCVSASLGRLPVLRSVATSIRKRRGLRRRKHFVSLKKNEYNSSPPPYITPPPHFPLSTLIALISMLTTVLN